MERTSRHRHKELLKVINGKLRTGHDMFIGCPLTNVDYWHYVLSLHYPDRKIEKLEDGVRVS